MTPECLNNPHPATPHVEWHYDPTTDGCGAWVLQAAPADGVFRVIGSDGRCRSYHSALVAERAGQRLVLGWGGGFSFPECGRVVWRMHHVDAVERARAASSQIGAFHFDLECVAAENS